MNRRLKHGFPGDNSGQGYSMVHVITPFSRFENLNFYLKNYADKGIIWHPLVTPQEGEYFASSYPDWVRPYILPRVPADRNIVKYKINMFLIDGNINDYDRYMILMDDDFIEPDFFTKLEAIQDDIVVCSMKRGQHYLGGHPIETLVASPDMHVGTIGFEQYILRGKILQQIRFRSDSDLSTGYPPHRQGDSDGHAYEMMAKLWPIKYVPDLYVYFNYLEKGRWDI